MPSKPNKAVWRSDWNDALVITANPDSNVVVRGSSDPLRAQKLTGTPRICRNTPRHKKTMRVMMRQQVTDLGTVGSTLPFISYPMTGEWFLDKALTARVAGPEYTTKNGIFRYSAQQY
jgi:hypothetical protein